MRGRRLTGIPVLCFGALSAAALAGCGVLRGGVAIECGDALPTREIVVSVSDRGADAQAAIPLAALQGAATDTAGLAVQYTGRQVRARCSTANGGVRIEVAAAGVRDAQLAVAASVPVTIRAVDAVGTELARTVFDPAAATHAPLTWR